jgi:hypothetical protein
MTPKVLSLLHSIVRVAIVLFHFAVLKALSLLDYDWYVSSTFPEIAHNKLYSLKSHQKIGWQDGAT